MSQHVPERKTDFRTIDKIAANATLNVVYRLAALITLALIVWILSRGQTQLDEMQKSQNVLNTSVAVLASRVDTIADRQTTYERLLTRMLNRESVP